MFARRGLQALRPFVRHGHGHAPAKKIDLNIPFEGVESRWAQLVPEQREVVTQQAKELMKGNWNNLSLNQKKTLYYVAFRSNEYPRTETGKVIGGIVLLLVATAGFFALTRSFAPAPPKTMTKEWKDAENEYAKKQNLNPISGISSEGYKGKGMNTSLTFQ
uniref:Cytochrome c oxidase subunit IV n=1 Tax=Euplotes crassus TaxID=5936 RepID=A0A7S3NVQ9_EUPCR|mmetsp:Transcript_26533/g.26406  ORF Transcript_26533/g.26406 Transcript_26533/m.26406 type:complete len:161 (+) Transcript_26533:45-527(+)|eukprot:CAMPEP_0197014076 /NCGR_PEP_ID=MMETSP1380-20130617/68728_1 /TAXON_ID=5936 /ORGANISM="Euplotes crassus, Strain CT5" /LENGTH=160 /DNA_ID=CAMNT_0042438787 /DNA_START=45 /DNA_END=527 /DNA_ORIENTATION=-